MVENNYQNEMSQNESIQDTASYRCPACGAAMVFDAQRGQMRCDYCGAFTPIEIGGTIESNDLDFSQGTVDWNNEVRSFNCENCSAKTILNDTEITKECPYCGSPNIVETADIKGIKPTAVLPFAMNATYASDSYHKWAKSKLLAPRAFKKYVKEHDIHGVYSPCWVYESATYSTYSGVVGDYYYVTVKTSNGYQRVRKVRYRKVRGNYSANFGDIMVEASPKIEQHEFQQIMPFDLSRSVPYDNKFLSGYAADHYNKSLQEGWCTARSTIDSGIRNAIIRTLKCDVVQSLDVSTRYDNKRFKYVLVPLYIGGTKYKDKLYSFIMNGTNGKTIGKTPVSKAKVFFIALGVLTFLAGVYFIMQIIG